MSRKSIKTGFSLEEDTLTPPSLYSWTNVEQEEETDEEEELVLDVIV
jgi:hypothetical protein